MSMQALGKVLLTAAALVLGCGCARSPDPRLYTLTAHEADATFQTRGLVVEVRRPHVAGYLDRREIVREVADHRLDLEHGAIWAEPLGGMLGRVLAADLALRLPDSQVVNEQSFLSATPDVRVDVAVQRLEQSARSAVLEAQVSVTLAGPDGPTELARVKREAALASEETAALVAAMNRLLGELADSIAQAIAAAPPVPPVPPVPLVPPVSALD